MLELCCYLPLKKFGFLFWVSWQKRLSKKIKLTSAQIIWLDTDYSLILKRAKDNERGCEDFLLKKSTYDILREFYRETLSLLHDNKLISLKIIKSE